MGDTPLAPEEYGGDLQLLLTEERKKPNSRQPSDGLRVFRFRSEPLQGQRVPPEKFLCRGAMRRINTNIPSFEEMRIPEVLKHVALKPRGMVLITGPTGSGKSTTLAAMVGHINENRTAM